MTAPGLPIGTVSCVSVTFPERRSSAVAAGFIAKTPECKVWTFTEAFDFDIEDVVPAGILTHQEGAKGSPRSALAIAWRPEVDMQLVDVVGAVTRAQNRRGRRQDIRDRPALRFTADGYPVTLVHTPPLRIVRLNRAYSGWLLRRERGRTIIGDLNRPASWVKRVMPRARFISEGTQRKHVMHIIGRSPWRVTMLRRVPKSEIPGAPDHHGLVGLISRR